MWATTHVSGGLAKSRFLSSNLIMDKMEMMYTSYSPRVVCQNALGFFTRGTIFSSIFNLLTTCIGAGTLSLPYAFAEGGLVFSSVLFFLVMLMSIMVGLYLYDSKRYCRNISPDIEVDGIEDLAQVAFGVVGRVSSHLSCNYISRDLYCR